MVKPDRIQCSWLFGRGASIANGLSWGVPDNWKKDLLEGKVTRKAHVELIKNAIRKEMKNSSVHCRPYRRLLEIMNQNGHRSYQTLTTTNWDFLLQREVNTWLHKYNSGVIPHFLGADGAVRHFNGSAEEGFVNRSPFLLETDSAYKRKKTPEAETAFNRLFWSQTIVIVGISFEADTDKGILGALHTVEDETPIGNARFVVVDPSQTAIDKTFSRLAGCFPRARGVMVQKDLEQWISLGMPELKGLGIFE